MKKITCSIIALSLSALSATAFACPKGTTLQGGEGPHHKGGKCVLASGAPAKKAEKKKADVTNAKTEAVKDKAEKKADTAKEKATKVTEVKKDKVEKPKV